MFTLAFNRQRRVVLARFSGELGRADIGTFDHAFGRFIDVEGCAHLVIDFTAVNSVAMPDQAMVDRGKRPHRCPGYHRIVVAPQPEISELYRLFSANQSMVGSTAPKMVKTVEHALVHLGVGEPDFLPIETPSPSRVIRLRK